MTFLLLPGDRAASRVGLQEGSEHQQIFRMFTNTAFWGLIGVLLASSISF
jgi:hypothetical protein